MLGVKVLCYTEVSSLPPNSVRQVQYETKKAGNQSEVAFINFQNLTLHLLMNTYRKAYWPQIYMKLSMHCFCIFFLCVHLILNSP